MIPRPVQCDEVVPPPRQHVIRFHGLCAARATDRAAFVALAPNRAPSAATADAAPPLSPSRRIPWAQLLARVFAADALACPDCHGRMRVLALLTDPQPVAAILSHLSLPTAPPPIAAARAPPTAELWDE